MGDNASAGSVRVLGNASFGQLMAGKPTDEMTALFGKKKAAQYMQQTKQQEISDLISKISQGTGPEAREFQALLKKNKGNVTKTLSSERGSNLAGFLGEGYGLGDYSELRSGFKVLGNDVAKGSGKNRMKEIGAKGSAADLGAKNAQSATEFATMIQELDPKNLQDFNNTFSIAVQNFKTLTDIPSNAWNDTVNVIKAIESLVEKVSKNSGVDKRILQAPVESNPKVGAPSPSYKRPSNGGI